MIANTTRSFPAAFLMAMASLLVSGTAQGENAVQLPALKAKVDQVSISGLSSGAFMTHQIHIAHSARFIGAGVIAGGPWGCAIDKLENETAMHRLPDNALKRCMETGKDLLSVAHYKCFVRLRSFKADSETVNDPTALEDCRKYYYSPAVERQGNLVDNPAALADQKVYLFSGSKDKTVITPVAQRAAELYEALGMDKNNIKTVFDETIGGGASHGWLTIDEGEACDALSADSKTYMRKCGYDQSGALLKWIHLDPETVKEPEKGAEPTGTLTAFDQTEFVCQPGSAVPGDLAIDVCDYYKNAKSYGILDHGYFYTPKGCEGDKVEDCSLHVVMHGCKQSFEMLGMTFIEQTGMMEWADANNIMLLFPQAAIVRATDLLNISGFVPYLDNPIYGNPKGCWNWWGYSKDDHFPDKNGVQIRAIMAMIDRLTGQ